MTGGASGIGAACASAFAREGAHVIIADFNQDEGKESASRIRDFGGQAQFVRVDVSSQQAVSEMIQFADPVKILVNAAGVLFYGTATETSEAEWDRVMNVNLKGTFLCCKAAIPAMTKHGGGSIINFSSTTGAHDACAHAVAYVTSKGGVAAMTRALAIDHAMQGIRVNAICPGPTDTPMLRKALSPEQITEFAKTFPMARLGFPSEIAAAAVFLASQESSFMTGSLLFVDGGQSAEI